MNRQQLENALNQYERDRANSAGDPELLSAIHRALGDELISTLHAIGEQSLGYWEKEQLAFGIDKYAGQVAAWAPSTFGIRMCLQAIDNALLPKDQRNDGYTEPDEYIDDLTLERLVHAAESIRAHVR